jgi:putative acetyltransferase
MLHFQRTNSDNPHFQEFIKKLNSEFNIRYGELQKTYDQFNFINDLPTVIIAREGNEPVGCGCFKPFSADAVEIKRMFVEPAHRGKGIGAGVLKELEIWAREIGYDRTVLETGINQPEAIRLYQKLGYQTIPNYGPYVNMPTSICMTKTIK